MEQGGVKMVQNGAGRGSNGVKWDKMGWKECRMGQGGWKWCKMVQGGAAMVENGARQGSSSAKWCKEGR